VSVTLILNQRGFADPRADGRQGDTLLASATSFGIGRQMMVLLIGRPRRERWMAATSVNPRIKSGGRNNGER
jgi:hypothetical protein